MKLMWWIVLLLHLFLVVLLILVVMLLLLLMMGVLDMRLIMGLDLLLPLWLMRVMLHQLLLVMVLDLWLIMGLRHRQLLVIGLDLMLSLRLLELRLLELWLMLVVVLLVMVLGRMGVLVLVQSVSSSSGMPRGRSLKRRCLTRLKDLPRDMRPSHSRELRLLLDDCGPVQGKARGRNKQLRSVPRLLEVQTLWTKPVLKRRWIEGSLTVSEGRVIQMIHRNRFPRRHEDWLDPVHRRLADLIEMPLVHDWLVH